MMTGNVHIVHLASARIGSADLFKPNFPPFYFVSRTDFFLPACRKQYHYSFILNFIRYAEHYLCYVCRDGYWLPIP